MIFTVWFPVNHPGRTHFIANKILAEKYSYQGNHTWPFMFYLSITLLNYSHSWKQKRKMYYKQWQLIKGPLLLPNLCLFNRHAVCYLCLSFCLGRGHRWQIPKRHIHIADMKLDIPDEESIIWESILNRYSERHGNHLNA